MMYPDQSCPSTSSLQSLSSIGSYSSREHHSTQYRWLRQNKVVTDKDMPFSLRMVSRSPREILEKKMEGQTGAEEVEDIDKVDVEKEIQVKLFYLGRIHRLKEGRRSFSQGDEEVASLLMRIKDMEEERKNML